MAKVRSALFKDLHGKVGSIDLRTRKHNKIDLSKSRFPRNVKTQKQTIHRQKYGEAVGDWHGFTEEEKGLWKEAGKAYGISGFNCFIMSRLIPPEAYFVYNNTQQDLNSLTWADLTGVSINTTSLASLIRGRLSLQVTEEGGTGCDIQIRVTIDDVVVGGNSQWVPVEQEQATFVMFSANVEVGEHTVKGQYKVSIADSLVSFADASPNYHPRTLELLCLA